MQDNTAAIREQVPRRTGGLENLSRLLCFFLNVPRRTGGLENQQPAP